MSTIQLDIVTPERRVYSEPVDMVITRAAEGDIGILPKHAPFVSPLKITVVRIKREDKEELVAVSGGFLEVSPDQVTILAEAAEKAEDVDVARAQRAKERAEERLSAAEGDSKRAELALQRALNRLNIVG